MLIKSRKVINLSVIEDKSKKAKKRAREGKNAEKARHVEDVQATTGYLNFNCPEMKKKKLRTWNNSTLQQIQC